MRRTPESGTVWSRWGCEADRGCALVRAARRREVASPEERRQVYTLSWRMTETGTRGADFGLKLLSVFSMLLPPSHADVFE